MTIARLRAFLSVPIILLFRQHFLEGASFSGGFGFVVASVAGFGKAPLAAHKLALSAPSRFQLLAGRQAFQDSGDPNGVVRRKFSKILCGLALLGPPALEVYSRMGSKDADFREDLFPQPSHGTWDDLEHVTLVFHGSGGQDKLTDALMQTLKRSDNKTKYSSMIEWRKYSSNFLQASFNGQRIGRCAAKQLLERTRNVKSVHVIGISVGAFAADSVCNEVKATLKDSVDIQLTLLDPFTQRGIFDIGYGARKYGENADYFQQFLNTDDPVPSTNKPLQKSVCYDVTAIRPAEITFGHDWPVAYYAKKQHTGIVPQADRLPRGTIVRLEQ